jgi:hypothetical protein
MTSASTRRKLAFHDVGLQSYICPLTIVGTTLIYNANNIAPVRIFREIKCGYPMKFTSCKRKKEVRYIIVVRHYKNYKDRSYQTVRKHER